MRTAILTATLVCALSTSKRRARPNLRLPTESIIPDSPDVTDGPDLIPLSAKIVYEPAKEGDEENGVPYKLEDTGSEHRFVAVIYPTQFITKRVSMMNNTK